MSQATARTMATSAQSIRISGLDGDQVDLDAATLAGLRARLHGRVMGPYDPGFDEAVVVWNAMIVKRPALVVQPLSATDVRVAVAFAQEHGILLSVKGGGHHAAGTAIADGGLMLDMSRMRQVVVDTERRLARVQGGCRLGDVDVATQAEGLATVLGSDADTGVAGLTLGGGFGWLSRRFGWAVDNLEEVEVVTADGQVRRAAQDENEDLFWALCGGGGNFGVVTRFTFRLHEVGPMVTGGQMMWEESAAERVLEAYRTVTEAAPRELSVALTMRHAPHAEAIPAHLRGRPVIGILACHSGDATSVDQLLAPFRAIPAPLDTIRRRPYVDQQFVLGVPQPAGFQQYWKSEFLPKLTDGFCDEYRRSATAQSSQLSQLIMVQLGGAIGDRAADATAMANRDAEYILLAAGTWRTEDPEGAAHLQWVRSTWEAMRPYSVGGNYINAQTADEDDGRTQEAYGDGYTRLTRVKAKYDPGNFFSSNRNISPAVR